MVWAENPPFSPWDFKCLRLLFPDMTQQYPDDWAARARVVKQRDNYECQNCGVPGGPRGEAELHTHHIVPVKNYGSHHIDNLITLCKQCHDAADNDGNARTIPISKRGMGQYEFEKYKEMMHEELEAWYDENDEVWHLPVRNVNITKYD